MLFTSRWEIIHRGTRQALASVFAYTVHINKIKKSFKKKQPPHELIRHVTLLPCVISLLFINVVQTSQRGRFPHSPRRNSPIDIGFLTALFIPSWNVTQTLRSSLLALFSPLASSSASGRATMTRPKKSLLTSKASLPSSPMFSLSAAADSIGSDGGCAPSSPAAVKRACLASVLRRASVRCSSWSST